MRNVGIGKTTQHILRKGTCLRTNILYRRQDLFQHYCLEEGTHILMLHTFIYGVEPSEESQRHRYGMAAVQYAQFLFTVRGDAGSDQHTVICLVEGQHLLYIGASFDSP